MNEIEFVESIDACFPYEDEKEWRSLIQQGKKISANASFMVLHEICGAPDDLSRPVLRQMLAEWIQANTHLLKDEFGQVAKGMIEGDVLECDQIVKLMEEVGNYKDLYAALGILCYACPDEDSRVELVYKRIVKQWRKA